MEIWRVSVPGRRRGKGKGPEAALCSALCSAPYSAVSLLTGRAGEVRPSFCGAWRLWLAVSLLCRVRGRQASWEEVP